MLCICSDLLNCMYIPSPLVLSVLFYTNGFIFWCFPHKPTRELILWSAMIQSPNCWKEPETTLNAFLCQVHTIEGSSRGWAPADGCQAKSGQAGLMPSLIPPHLCSEPRYFVSTPLRHTPFRSSLLYSQSHSLKWLQLQSYANDPYLYLPAHQTPTLRAIPILPGVYLTFPFECLTTSQTGVGEAKVDI